MALMVKEGDISAILRGRQFSSSEELGLDPLNVTVVPMLFDIEEGRIHFSVSRSFIVGTQGAMPQMESFALSLPIKPADPRGISSEEIIVGPEPLSRVQPEFTSTLRRTLYALADESGKNSQLSSRQIVLKTAEGIVRFADADSHLRSQLQVMVEKAQETYGTGPFGQVLEEVTKVTTPPEKKL